MRFEWVSQNSHGRLICILAVLSYFFLMFGNGIISLTHPDEVFYAQSAKEMLQHNNWLTPMIFDKPQFEKPVFFYWLMMIAFKLFGTGPFVARFWPAFFAMLGVGATYWMAWTIFKSKRLAFLSGIILSSSFIYLALARAVLTDMVFSIWVLIALAIFCYGFYNRKHKDASIILFFAVMGVSVLTKGILGVCFSLSPVLAFLIYKKERTFFRNRATLWGFFLFIAIAVPWHAVMFQLYGQTFLDEYWQNVHVRRLFDAEHPKNNLWYFYLGLMFVGVMPWSFLFLPTAACVYKVVRGLPGLRDPLVFLLFWILGVYVFVQPASSKLASYIFPVFPAVAILLAFYLDRVLDEKKGPFNALSISGYLIALVLLGGAVYAVIYAKKYPGIVVNMTPVYVFSVLSVIMAALLVIFNLKNQPERIIFAKTSITAVILIFLFLGKPYAEPWVSCKDITDVFKALDTSDKTVLASKFYVRGVRFYLDRPMAVIDVNGKPFFSPHPVPFLDTREKVMDFLASQGTTYGIVKKTDLYSLNNWVLTDEFKVTQIGEPIGGKFIVKIEKVK
ncbi:MAG: hypothetical protein A2Z88_04130 [Omnitrophica WOR_2 bacterium GWA2_47_8]|nr:MAG: hypothetical protein A2Z88_04130 [Omnitrophica WOR_2 bacterium GWA2_47_8]